MQFQFAKPIIREHREWPPALIPPEREEGGRVLRSSGLPLSKLRWRATALVLITPLYSDLRVAYLPPWGCLLSGWGHHPVFHPDNLLLGDEMLNPEGPPSGRCQHHRLLPGFHARFHGPPNLNAGKPEALLELAWSGACLSSGENALQPGFSLFPEDRGAPPSDPPRLIPPPLRDLALRLGDSDPEGPSPAKAAWQAKAGFRERREGGWNVRAGWWVPALDWDWLEASWKAAYLRDWYAESTSLVWQVEYADLPWDPVEVADRQRRRRAEGQWHPGPPPSSPSNLVPPPLQNPDGAFLRLGELYPRAYHCPRDPGPDPEALLWASANRQLRSNLLDPMAGPEPEPHGVELPEPRVEGRRARGGWRPNFHLQFCPSEWPRIREPYDGPGRSLESLFMHIRKDRQVPRSIKEHDGNFGFRDIWPPIWEGIAEREQEARRGEGRGVRRGELPMYLSHEMQNLWE